MRVGARPMKLRLAPDFTLPLEAVTQTFAILAKRGVGKSYLAAVIEVFRKVTIRARTTFDSSTTPKVGETVKAPKRLAPVDLEALKGQITATIERAKAEDPRELRRQVAELKAQLARVEKSSTPGTRIVDTKRVEIPVLSAVHLKRLEAAIRPADKAIEKLGAVKDGAQAAIAGLVTAAKPIADELKVLRVGPWAATTAASLSRSEQVRMQQGGAPARQEIAKRPTAVMVSRRPELDLPAGEARLLTAVAQTRGGATREQLSILAGFKRSTRDLYLQRLGRSGYIELRGDRVHVTAEGQAALGPDFAPLPTGDALRARWLTRLPEGERRVLQAVLTIYPDPVSRDAISTATGYQRSTRDLYLQRLARRRLLEAEGRGAVRASAELFG